MLPLVVSPVNGTGLPRMSVPFPVADQLTFEETTIVQLKFVEAPAARVELPPVQVAQLLVPVTETPVIVESPVFFSVTVIVTEVPGATVVEGLTLDVVRVVA